MSFALQGGAGRGFGVHFEADAPGKLEGTAVVVNNEANHSRHEFRHRNGDDFDLGGREGTLPQTAIQHATHAGRVVHGLALVVNATLKAARHFDAVDGDDIHAGVAGQRPDRHVVRGRRRAPNHAEKGGAGGTHDDFAPRGDGAPLWRPRKDSSDTNVGGAAGKLLLVVRLPEESIEVGVHHQDLCEIVEVAHHLDELSADHTARPVLLQVFIGTQHLVRGQPEQAEHGGHADPLPRGPARDQPLGVLGELESQPLRAHDLVEGESKVENSRGRPPAAERRATEVRRREAI